MVTCRVLVDKMAWSVKNSNEPGRCFITIITQMNRLLLFLAIFFIRASCFSQLSRQSSHYEKNTLLPKVKNLDLSTIDPASFSVDEWYVPYYLEHFSEVANSVVDSGANKGFIDIAVWRPKEINKPYNARIMENIQSLAWFYTKKRPWNVYYGDAALRSRLEAALNFWCNIQSDDGRFSEYKPGQWSLAPTAFATKFVGRALFLLHHGPAINRDVYERAGKAFRKALYAGFTNKDLWEHGKKYTNQYANFWGGALMYLKLWPDQEIEKLFHERFDQSMSVFQSPCGFFYEAGGPDWGYDLSTHHSDLDLAWNFLKGTDLQNNVTEKMRRWYDWFSYNAVKEPGNNIFYLNRAIETRQHHGYIEKNEVEDPSFERGAPEAEFVPTARAFELSKEQRSHSMLNRYDSMRKEFPRVAPLKEGEFRAFSPYTFLHDGLIQWYPSSRQKKEAVANLPYLKKDRFTQIRHDGLANTSYTFIRRPDYYAIFNSGKIVTAQERFGLGLIWNPDIGTLLQSQSRTDTAAWGTKARGKQQVFEAADIFPEIILDNKNWNPVNGIRNISAKSLLIKYPLGENGKKTILFEDNKIVVDVTCPGAFTEILPLLVSSDEQLKIDNDIIQIHKISGNMQLKLQNANGIDKKPFDDNLGTKTCEVLEVNATDHLRYTISF